MNYYTITKTFRLGITKPHFWDANTNIHCDRIVPCLLLPLSKKLCFSSIFTTLNGVEVISPQQRDSAKMKSQIHDQVGFEPKATNSRGWRSTKSAIWLIQTLPNYYPFQFTIAYS